MPMIDVYATAGTFTDKHQLAADLAATLMAIEKVPDIPMFRQNTGDPALAERTWVLLTEAVPGGWGLSGHANTNDELVAAARKQIAELRARAGGPTS